MKRNRSRRTPTSALTDATQTAPEIALGNVTPNENTSPTPAGARKYLEIRHDDDNRIVLDPQTEGTAPSGADHIGPHFYYQGKLIKLRPTAICVNGVEQTVLVFREKAAGETD